MKAIDTRLREIKLTKKDDLDGHPGDEGAAKDKDVEKLKREDQTAKRKYEEKDPELQEAEDQYFKIIQAVSIFFIYTFIVMQRL